MAKKTASPVMLETITPVAPAVAPTLEAEKRFSPMLQGTGTNRFTQLSTRKEYPNVNPITGSATLSTGSLTVFIEKYNSLAGGLRVSTHKLLDALTIVLTAHADYRGGKESTPMVALALDDFMTQCGIPLTKASKDKTRRRVREDLEMLYSTSIEWSEPQGQGKQHRDYAKMRIISYQGIQNGIIQVRFSPEMAAYLTNAYVMQYPLLLFKVDERNPSAYYIGKKLLLHHSMTTNKKRGTGNIISVRALLDCIPDIPAYEDVMAKDRHLHQRIIQPFENALNALNDEIPWRYTNAKGKDLSKDQYETFTYETFISCYICFDVPHAPQQTMLPI